MKSRAYSGMCHVCIRHFVPNSRGCSGGSRPDVAIHQEMHRGLQKGEKVLSTTKGIQTLSG